MCEKEEPNNKQQQAHEGWIGLYVRKERITMRQLMMTRRGVEEEEEEEEGKITQRKRGFV